MFGPWFWWALLGLILIGAETFIPGLAIIFFGLGALATALLSTLPLFSSSPALQALFWTASSLASLVFLRRPFKRLLKGSAFYREGEAKVDTVAGETAVVTDHISPDHPGRVHFRGTSWMAVAYLESLDPGITVRVVSREGLSLVVTRDFLDQESPALPDGANLKEDT